MSAAQWPRRRRRAAAPWGLACVLAIVAAVAAQGSERGTVSAAALEDGRIVAGKSVQGRPIVAVRIGDPEAERVVLVAGLIHGDERAGAKITKALKRDHRDAEGVQVWVLDSLNPDGALAKTRTNARGVDLNRNFGYLWRAGPRDGYYPGPKPFSEPEARAARSLIRLIGPDLTVWYHQPWKAVLACKGKPRIAKRYANLSGMRTSCQGRRRRGTATAWQRHVIEGSHAFVVELGPAGVGGEQAARHARAVLAIGRDGADAAAGRASRGAAVRPPIRKWLIPYGAKRRRDMAAYSKRHYGKPRYELVKPKLIVEHYAEAGSVRSIYNTFAPNRRDPEFGELPGVCSHYAVAADGTIFRFVPEGIRCRHVVGLNHVAIGIEHVGFSDGDVLGRKPQMRASLRLSRWLRCRHGLPVKQVIGHNESLNSRFYKELDPDFQGQTHGDFDQRSMRIYRRKLAGLGGC